jgi:hypothetical protein
MQNVDKNTKDFIERFWNDGDNIAGKEPWMEPWMEGVLSILDTYDELIHKLQI